MSIQQFPLQQRGQPSLLTGKASDSDIKTTDSHLLKHFLFSPLAII